MAVSRRRSLVVLYVSRVEFEVQEGSKGLQAVNVVRMAMRSE